MFTWPTPLKYPESMSKYTEAIARVYLDMHEVYLDSLAQLPGLRLYSANLE